MSKAESLLETDMEHQCMADARTLLGQGVCVCECVCKHKKLSQQRLWFWKARPVTQCWEHCCMGAWRRATAPVFLSPEKILSWQQIPCHLSMTRSGQGLLRIARVPG